jgi:hypothetical protein
MSGIGERASDSGRLVTLVRRLTLRCNRDGKAFREREGVRLKVGAWFTHVRPARSDLDSRRRGPQGPGGEHTKADPGLGTGSEPWNCVQIMDLIGCPDE